MHVSKLDINGNSLVGLYIFPLDNIVLVGNEVPEEDYSLLEEIFQAKVFPMSVAGTSLLGVFLATDGEKLLVPNILFNHEKELLDKTGIPYILVNTANTCLGNNLVFTKKGLVCNPSLEKSAIEQIVQFLNIPVQLSDFEIPIIGSFIAHNNSFGLVSHDLSDKQIASLSKHLGLRLIPGTVNMGSPQVSSGIAVNDKGFVVGTISGGPEIMNADHALGFIDG
ncbi:translation initiation factor IF-6 [Candidatus Woesearchaeota archaeon]|nr:translation initiation factor IF-6 [Candidatus Woesearchaeota archaeon]